MIKKIFFLLFSTKNKFLYIFQFNFIRRADPFKGRHEKANHKITSLMNLYKKLTRAFVCLPGTNTACLIGSDTRPEHLFC